MRTSKFSWPLLFLPWILSACAISGEAQKADTGRARAERFEDKARVGMSKEEISQATGDEIGNCQGSPQGLEVCEVKYYTSAPRYGPLPLTLIDNQASNVPSDQSLSTYTTYKLLFEKGRLQRLQSSSEKNHL